MATADHIIQATKGIKKSFDTGAQNDIMKWVNIPIFNVQPTNEWTEIFTTTEGFTGMVETSEHGTPAVNALGDGYSTSITQKRFTNAYETTESDMQKMGDSTTKIDMYLTRQRDRALKQASLFFAQELHKFLNYAFATTYYAAPDAAALCATHTWKSGETFTNNGTAAFCETAMDDALVAISQIADGVGEEMQINPDTIVVRYASPAAKEARKLFAEGITPTSVGDVNIYKGSVTIIETPYITYANSAYWFLFDTSMPSENPLYAGMGKFPSYTAPKVGDNEAVRQNITGFWDQGIVNQPYMLYGLNGTT